MSELANRIKILALANTTLKRIEQIATAESAKEHDISEEDMESAIELYDRLAGLALAYPELKPILEQCEIHLESIYQSMDWYYENIHNRTNEMGDWS